MKKKKLKVQVAALAMTGAIAAAPLTVRAEEASTAVPATTSTSSTEASATAAAPAASTATTPATMLMYGKEASNRKQEIDRQHYTIPNQRPKDKHCGKI